MALSKALSRMGALGNNGLGKETTGGHSVKMTPNKWNVSANDILWKCSKPWLGLLEGTIEAWNSQFQANYLKYANK